MQMPLQTEIAVWAQDFLDKDTLEVSIGEEDFDLTFLDVGDDYDTRYMSSKWRKVATFVWDFDVSNATGEYVLCANADEVEMHIKFVSNGQTFTANEQAVLSDWCITNADGKDLLTLLDSSDCINITYRRLIDYYYGEYDENGVFISEPSGIRYTCKKPAGYYMDKRFFKPVDSNLVVTGVIETSKQRDYSKFNMTFDRNDEHPDDGAFRLPMDIYVTFDKQYLCPTELTLLSELVDFKCKILSVYNGSEKIECFTPWYGNNENDIKIYLEPYTGVDLSNVEVYIYNTQMQVKTDPQNGKKYFIIEKGKCPVDYYTYTEDYDLSPQSYKLDIKNIDLSNSNLFTTLDLKSSSNNEYSTYIEDSIYFAHCSDFTRKDLTIYYIPTSVTVRFFNFESGVKPSKLKINGTNFDISNYAKLITNGSVPNIKDDPYIDYSDEQINALDSYYYEMDPVNHVYYYKYKNVKINSKDFYIILFIKNNGDIQSIDFTFAITGNTTIELVV